MIDWADQSDLVGFMSQYMHVCERAFLYVLDSLWQCLRAAFLSFPAFPHTALAIHFLAEYHFKCLSFHIVYIWKCTQGDF